jgi:hypothetical protein
LLRIQGVELQRDGLVVCCGAVELDGAGEAVMVLMRPSLPFLLQKLEGRRLQVHLLLGDHQFQAPLALFQVHQGCQGNADRLPLVHGQVQVLDRRHVAGCAVGQETISCEPEVEGVIAVELRWKSAPTVITIVVVLGAKQPFVNSLGPLLTQIGGHHFQEYALGIDHAILKIAVAVPGQQKALLEQGGKAQKDAAVIVLPDVAVVDELNLLLKGELVEGLVFRGLPVVAGDNVTDLDGTGPKYL